MKQLSYLNIGALLLLCISCASMNNKYYILNIDSKVPIDTEATPYPVSVSVTNTFGLTKTFSFITPFGISGNINLKEDVPLTLERKIISDAIESGYFTIRKNPEYQIIIDIIDFSNKLDKIWSGTFYVEITLGIKIKNIYGNTISEFTIVGRNAQRNMKGLPSLALALDNTFSNACAKIPYSDIYSKIDSPDTQKKYLTKILEEPLYKIYKTLENVGLYNRIACVYGKREYDNDIVISIIQSRLSAIFEKKIQLISREDLDKLLVEQELQLSKIIDESTVTAIGKIKGVDAFIIVDLIKNGKIRYIVLKTISVETGIILNQQILETSEY